MIPMGNAAMMDTVCRFAIEFSGENERDGKEHQQDGPEQLHVLVGWASGGSSL